MVALSDVCALIVDCEHKTAPKADDGWPLIRTTDIGRGRLDLSNVQRVDADAYEEWTRRATPQPGDLILAREAPVGNVAIVSPGLEPVLGQRTVLIRPDPEKVDPDFLTYRLLAPDMQYWMQGVANGATVPHLNMEDIRALPLPEMPPIGVQRRIGADIAAFDDLIENNLRRVDVLEEMARLIYREWFVHFRFPGHEGVELVNSDLGPIPNGWKVTTLSEHAALERENVKPADHPTEIFDHYSIPAFDDRRLPVDEPGADIKSSKYLIRGERTLLSKLNPRFPRVWQVDASQSDHRSICSTEFLVLAADQDWPASFVRATVSDSDFGGRLATMAGGTSTSHQRVKPDDVMALPISGPEPSVVRQYDAVVAPMLRLADNLMRQSEVLREARDLLLPRLVSGELDVSDLDLEPAAAG